MPWRDEAEKKRVVDDALYQHFRDRHRRPAWDGPSVEKVIRRMAWTARRSMFGRETRQALASCAYELAVGLDRERRDLERLVRYAYVVHLGIIRGVPPRRRKRRKVPA